MSESDAKQTGLALAGAAPARSLLADLAGAAGMDPTKYYNTIKALCGCNGASDEHFAALMMVANAVGLNPIMRQLYLVPTQKGVTPVVGVDGYLIFLHRALKDGYLEWHKYEAGWFPDPKLSPDKAAQSPVRGARVTFKFKGRDEVTHYEYWTEVYRDTGPWKQHGARMMMHKTYSQAIRYHLGLYVPDAEEAGALREDEPRTVAAEVRPAAAPIVPIAGLKAPGKPEFAPPPPLEPVVLVVEAQGNPTPMEPSSGGGPGNGGPVAASSASPAPFDAEESKRLDAMLFDEGGGSVEP